MPKTKESYVISIIRTAVLVLTLAGGCIWAIGLVQKDVDVNSVKIESNRKNVEINSNNIKENRNTDDELLKILHKIDKNNAVMSAQLTDVAKQVEKLGEK